MFALLAALSLGAVVPQDTVPEPVVIDLRVGRITGTTVQAYRVRSEVLLPLSQFFQLVEIRHRLTLEGRLEATVDPGNLPIVIDPRSDSMRYGDRRVRIEREFIRFESAELYVGSERLGDLLGVMFAVDWSDLTATVIDPSTLPIARRLRREAAREAYLRRPDGMHADITLGLERPSWDGVVVDYSLFSPSSDPLAGSTYGFGLGADVGGGSLEMLAQSVGPAERGQLHVDASWTGVWRENRWVKQLRLGDVASTGPRSRALEGISITNAPFVRPSLVGSLRYAGSLEPGWSVEAYRGGDLVAYDSADASGGFAINLPVRYGAVDRAGWTRPVLAGLASRPDPSVRGTGRKSEQRLGDPKRGDRRGTRARCAPLRAVGRSAVGRRVRPLCAGFGVGAGRTGPAGAMDRHRIPPSQDEPRIFLLRWAIRADQHRCRRADAHAARRLAADRRIAAPAVPAHRAWGSNPRRVRRTRDVRATAGPLGPVLESGVAADQRRDRAPGGSRLLVRVRGAFPHGRGAYRGGCNLAARQRRRCRRGGAHLHDDRDVVLLGDARRDIGARAGGGPTGQRHAVPSGFGALGPPDRSAGRGPRTVTRTFRPVGTRLHGRERERHP